MQINDNVRQFRKLVDTDTQLQQELRSHVGAGRWNSSAVIDLANRRGLELSVADLVADLAEDDELSDFELEMVTAASPLPCDDT